MQGELADGIAIRWCYQEVTPTSFCVLRPSCCVLCVATLAERDLKSPFRGEPRYRSLLENALHFAGRTRSPRIRFCKRLDSRHRSYCGPPHEVTLLNVC